MAERHSFVRVPTLALMTRRLRLAPSATSTAVPNGASTAAAGRFVRDMCRNWGVPDSLLGEAGTVVRALLEDAVTDDAAAFELVVEARSHTVTVRVRDRNREYAPRTAGNWRTDPSRETDRPWTAGAWTFVSSGDGEETWAVAPRDQHPAPHPRR